MKSSIAKLVDLIYEEAKDYVWGVKESSRVANQYKTMLLKEDIEQFVRET